MKNLRLSQMICAGLIAASLSLAASASAQGLQRAGRSQARASAASQRAASQGAQSGVDHSIQPAEDAFFQGDLERARRLAFEHDDAGALLVRARLAEYDGDLELAAQFVRAAGEQTRDDELRARAAGELGRFLRIQGQWDEAEASLRQALQAAPEHAWPVRLELGRVLGLKGKRAEADSVLKPFSQAFNRGQFKNAREFYWLAQAMWEMDSVDDANFAFEKMYAADPTFVDGLVGWARLLLSKYNIGDAHRTLQEVLEVNPEQPEALVEMARLEIESSNYFGDAHELLARAEAVWAGNPRLLVTRAQLQVYDADYDLAIQTVDALLKRYPRNLDAMVIKAASLYLMDDSKGFEAEVVRALKLKPDFAEIFSETADFAQLVHRYLEVVELSKRALEVRSGFAPALLNLGIGLSRIGEEAEAIGYLKQAFSADPYNVRAFNMVELYDKQMPEFEFTAHERFRLRTHRGQTGLLNQLMAPVISEAIETYEQKYDYQVEQNLDVEIFPEAETFGVRSIGLPQVSPTGLCFGRIVISRSPSEADFNWRQVIWHEMAHVFHIQKAGYRVPRWFTEGLAEYETNIKDPSWARHLDVEIAQALRANRIPSVARLDHSFTRAESFTDILRAYHLASLAVHFIVETHGFKAINQMLEEFPRSLKTERVIEEVLSLKVDEFDRAFKGWLKARYANFNLQMLLDLSAYERVEVLKKRVKKDSSNPILRAKYAISLLGEGELDEAKAAMARALKLGPKNATVRYLAAVLEFSQGHTRAAYAHGMAVLDEFQEDYTLRVVLGEAAILLEDPVAAEVHLVAATQLYEDGLEAWVNLLKLARTLQDPALVARAMERVFELDQNDPDIAQAFFERASERGDGANALRAARRWVDIQPFEARAQRALARAALEEKNPEIAVAAYENLLHLRAGDVAGVRKEAARALEAAGFSAQAARFKVE